MCDEALVMGNYFVTDNYLIYSITRNNYHCLDTEDVALAGTADSQEMSNHFSC